MYIEGTCPAGFFSTVDASLVVLQLSWRKIPRRERKEQRGVEALPGTTQNSVLSTPRLGIRWFGGQGNQVWD